MQLKCLLIAQAFPLGSAFLVCQNQTTHTSAYEALPAVWEKNILYQYVHVNGGTHIPASLSLSPLCPSHETSLAERQKQPVITVLRAVPRLPPRMTTSKDTSLIASATAFFSFRIGRSAASILALFCAEIPQRIKNGCCLLQQRQKQVDYCVYSPALTQIGWDSLALPAGQQAVRAGKRKKTSAQNKKEPETRWNFLASQVSCMQNI